MEYFNRFLWELKKFIYVKQRKVETASCSYFMWMDVMMVCCTYQSVFVRSMENCKEDKILGNMRLLYQLRNDKYEKRDTLRHPWFITVCMVAQISMDTCHLRKSQWIYDWRNGSSEWEGDWGWGGSFKKVSFSWCSVYKSKETEWLKHGFYN